ncbi:MAG: DNA-3-methyladenine glycosylase I [Acidobacteria bacterium]|nr:DNA-3-methyladenine glycosylase I [Acidobacteriota bacterium]
MRRRCHWVRESDALMRTYHDEEWGVPLHNDRKLFELLVLESAQAGLSWRTILARREAYRRAFSDFDPEVVARFTDADVERLVGDASIIRNRQKIRAAVANARAFLGIVDLHGSFDAWIWSFVDGRPLQNRWWTDEELPASTPLSASIAREMKTAGFSFLGPTTVYAHMQATGMVNDHVVGCFRHAEVAAMA